MSAENQASGSAPAEGDKSAEHITLKVKSQDGNEIFFKIKRATQLKKLMDAYCARQAISPNTVRFLFDGERLQENATPKDLEMEDGDEIDAMSIEQHDIELFKELIANDKELLREEIHGFTPLRFAARHGQHDMMKIIGLPDDTEQLKDLFRLAGKDGFKEAIVLISQNLLLLTRNDTTIIEQLIVEVNPAMRPFALFPFKWAKMVPVLFLDLKKQFGEGFPIKRLKAHLV